MLITPRESLVDDLREYGEDTVAARVFTLSEEQYQRLSEIAYRHALTGMLLAKALALAAVEVIEGKPRALRRKRRQLNKAN